MDPHVAKLTTPEECEQFVINVAGEYLSFEAIVVRHPSAFDAKIVDRCKDRLARYQS